MQCQLDQAGGVTDPVSGLKPEKNIILTINLSLQNVIAAILDAHNTYRSEVAAGGTVSALGGGTQPAASNMRKLRWDAQLATRAQE